MAVRVVELNNGIETSSIPNPGTPTQDYDIIYKSYADATYQRAPIITGSLASPTLVSAGTNIAHNLTSADVHGIIFIAGNSNPVNLSSNPQIAVPTRIGQMLTVVGASDVNTVTLEHGSGLVQNGEAILGAKSMITYIALSLTEWVEFGRP